jgi:hypothetical protein
MRRIADETCFRSFSRLDSLAKATRARPILAIRQFLKPFVRCVFAGQRGFLIEHVEPFRRRRRHEVMPEAVPHAND